MKIGIDARFLTHPQPGGFKTYTENLVLALAQIDTVNDYIIYVDRPIIKDIFPRNNNFTFKVVNGSLPGIGMPIREQILLGREIDKDKPDIIHYLCNTAPIKPYKNSILTLHDIIQLSNNQPFQLTVNFASQKRWAIARYSKWTILHAVNTVNRIITVSQYEKENICEQLNIDPHIIRVIYLAPTNLFSSAPRETREKWRCTMSQEIGLPAKFILGVGYESRKNIPLILKMFSFLANQHPDLCLVIVVAENNSRSHFQQLAYAMNISDRVHLLPAQNAKKMAILYNLAELFVYPSERESFGLPPLEAMACGTPVIAMNMTSLPEILGDGALLIHGTDVETWITEVEMLLSNIEFRKKLVDCGLKQASKLSWHRCAEETIKVYRSVAQNG